MESVVSKTIPELPKAVVQVVRLVADGLTNEQIARELQVPLDYVKDRLKQATSLWQSRNRAHLVHLAHLRGALGRVAADA